jgi:tRNA threonylcarbamoyladenosine biosynthesis protein TsaE
VLPDEATTQRVGHALASVVERERAAVEHLGLVVTLAGDLGAGKTTVVRAWLLALGVQGPIKSPTFAVLEPYVISRLDFYHFDFYRFKSSDEFSGSGFRDHFGPARICAIEWPERGGERLPTPDLSLALHVQSEGRQLRCSAYSELGIQCLNTIATMLARPPDPNGGG